MAKKKARKKTTTPAAKAKGAKKKRASNRSSKSKKRYFEFVDGKSSKFWEIELTGSSHTTRYGRIGTDGQTKSKEFDDAEKAKASYEKLIEQKVKKGYVESTGKRATKRTPRRRKKTNKEVERRIRECAEKRRRYLDLSLIELEEVPESIASVHHINHLTIGGDAAITGLPGELGELQRLRSLSITGYGTHFEQLPKVVCELRALRRLTINAEMTSIPYEISELTKLESLSLWGDKIRFVPDGISKLSNLKWLDLRANRIQSLPESIGCLSNLEELNLRGNCLETLPTTIGQLSRLTDLHLSHNPLKKLPDTMGNLAQLESLYLHDTQLKTLPKQIGVLPKLNHITLGECPNLSQELRYLFRDRSRSASKTTQAIKSWLRGEVDPDSNRFQTIDDFRLPRDLRTAVDSNERPAFDFDEADNYANPPFRLRAASELCAEWLDIRGFDGAGGPWSIPCVRLMHEGKSEYDSNVLMWLPEQRRYATFDIEHTNLFVFHKRTKWSKIAADFPTYFFATNNGGMPDEEFAAYYEDSDCFSE